MAKPIQYCKVKYSKNKNYKKNGTATGKRMKLEYFLTPY